MRGYFTDNYTIMKNKLFSLHKLIFKFLSCIFLVQTMNSTELQAKDIIVDGYYIDFKR